MSFYAPPEDILATGWTEMPAEYRRSGQSPAWAAANKPGKVVDCFLEGPSFDAEGNLWLTDIPYGRVFRVSPEGRWTLVAEYDGWPNGLKFDASGQIWIADYKRGILRLDPDRGTVETAVSHRYSESFRGCNDLVFAPDGRLYFTDQGQSGLHMPNGRVYRFDPESERLDLLIDTCPSPNGIVVTADGGMLQVAMTRANAIWRMPLMADGGVSKAGLFVQLSGGVSGPDGLALDTEGGLWIAHAGNGCVWGVSHLGHPRWRILGGKGLTTTNLAFGGRGNREIFCTESDTGVVLRAEVPVAGLPMALTRSGA